MLLDGLSKLFCLLLLAILIESDGGNSLGLHVIAFGLLIYHLAEITFCRATVSLAYSE